MISTLSRIATLFIAVGILLTGHGLQLTLLPVFAVEGGWSSTLIGVTGSFYFLGFVAGCLLVPQVVSRVGHIRSFMVLAAVATIVLIAAALLFNFWAWLVLRFATGLAISGLYMIVESWLTEISPRDRRGSVLSIYLAISLIGMAAGQLPLTLLPPGDLRLFMLAALMLSLAIIPVGLTRISSPHPILPVRVTPATLMRASRVAVVCAGLAGMVIGAFWTLGPVVGGAFGLDSGRIGLLMAAGVITGAVAQYPIGRASDMVDRRLVIGTVAVFGSCICVFGALFVSSGGLFLFAVVALLCAAAMPMYGVCIALASDRTDLTLVEVTGGILLAHGIGSIVGPAIAAPAMALAGPGMFFVFAAACLTLMALWAFYRYFRVVRPAKDERHVPMLPRTSQVVAELLSDQGTSSGKAMR